MSTDSNPPTPPGEPAGGGPAASPGGPATGTEPPRPPAAGPNHPPGEEFFSRIRALGISRPDQGRWAAGVCAGIARRLGVDPLLVRGVFVVLAIVGGLGLLLYGIGWAFLPQDDGRIHVQQALRGDITAGFVGSVALIILDLGRDSGPWWNGGPWWHGAFFLGPGFGGLLTLVVIGVVVWWLLTRHTGGGPGGGSGGGGGTPSAGSPPPPYGAPAYGPPGQGPGYPPPGSGYTSPTGQGYTPPAGPGPGQASAAGFTPAPSAVMSRAAVWAPAPDPAAPSHMLTQVTLGVALLAAGLAAWWDHQVSDLPGPTWLLAAGVALGVLAVGVVVAGVLGRRAGGLAPLGILLACVVLAGAVLPEHGSISRFGAITWRPETVVQAERGITAGGREVQVDLTAPGITAGATEGNPVMIKTWLGLGHLEIAVPQGTPMEIRTSVGAGDVRNTTGVSSGGTGLSDTLHTGPPGAPLAVVTAHVGLGEIEIHYEKVVTQ